MIPALLYWWRWAWITIRWSTESSFLTAWFDATLQIATSNTLYLLTAALLGSTSPWTLPHHRDRWLPAFEVETWKSSARFLCICLPCWQTWLKPWLLKGSPDREYADSLVCAVPLLLIDSHSFWLNMLSLHLMLTSLRKPYGWGLLFSTTCPKTYCCHELAKLLLSVCSQTTDIATQ